MQGRRATRRESPPENPDVIIVGAGACGALAANELAQRGFSVVVLEAGKRYLPASDLQISEANAGRILWSEPRNFVGRSAVMPKTGVGVGGGTPCGLFRAAACPLWGSQWFGLKLFGSPTSSRPPH